MITDARLKRREEILNAAQQVLFDHGSEKVSLKAVSQQLGLTHAAIYRHFRDKDDLWFSLAQHWLLGTENHLAELLKTPAVSRIDQLHTWLNMLSQTKQDTNRDHPEVFRLYTDIVSDHEEIEKEHLQNLQQQLFGLFQITEPKETDIARMQAILDAFSFFYDPRYKKLWDNSQIRVRQENVWQLTAPQIRKWFDS
ncbi:TetR/AcrR family transcriptional regulator [Oenococcus sicerae]|uniref:TetR/AcrR family transcriptional regulator n=1 Tax=Oenococcus sicerae TaxID=2203724 RepID=UPI0010B5A7B9|nr:hypothetical protein OAL24_01482 [Oenococcus sicerae]